MFILIKSRSTHCFNDPQTRLCLTGHIFTAAFLGPNFHLYYLNICISIKYSTTRSPVDKGNLLTMRSTHSNVYRNKMSPVNCFNDHRPHNSNIYTFFPRTFNSICQKMRITFTSLLLHSQDYPLQKATNLYNKEQDKLS